MSLPPLQPTPNISRLLGPGETVVYTAKLHPLHGWPWLLAALAVVALAYATNAYLALLALPLLTVYLLPFRIWEAAVTTHRLLLRHGRFRIALDAIDPDHLDHYQLHQNPFTSLLHCGDVILALRLHRTVTYLPLPSIWHPMSFLEALTTLNPAFRAK
ncbi:MAG: hypothetical protein H6922_05110 [Pseudomonadaceae bacterium]|nr:hypothetical protein [Pseudomonadaceae bacterium]